MVDVSVKKRILIVDDERDVGDSIKIVLQEYGFDADIFTDPLEALKNFKPDFYDLVILDIRMPEINGFELYDKLKSKDAKIKTLFLTAVGDVEAYSTPSSKVYPVMGERHFAKKPISNSDLLEQVYSIMN
jgi:two-component system, OmpR family, response regulator ChvI